MATPTAPYYRLRLKTLKFISAVDAGAQGEIANVALIKRASNGEQPERVEATFRVVKTDEKLGLVFGWALATTLDGGQTPHVDLQQDAILDDDLIRVAAEFMEKSAASDVQHDDSPDGKIVFAMPLTSEVNAALGIKSDVHGLAIAMKPSPETFKRFVSKELNAFSIMGEGIRELVKAATKPKCADCGQYGSDGDENCKNCGGKMSKRVTAPTTKAVWTTADIDSLPDSSFLYIEPGGSKDSDGKTTPRSLRHFPYKTATGAIDLDHLRNAISRIPQSSLSKDLRDKLQVKAEKLLAAQHDKAAKRVSKADQGGESTVVATSESNGHQHTIDLDDPADGWQDQLTTSFNTAEGATNGHSHGWVFDPATGKVTILADSGHSHTVGAVVPADTIRQAQLNESGERCPNCGEMCDADCKFCPMCGCAMDGDAIPATAADDDSGPSIVLISARAPSSNSLRSGISPPSTATPTVKSDKEPTAMADNNDRVRELEAEIAMLQKKCTLTDADRAHIAKLSDVDALCFINLTPAQRELTLAEIAKADVVVYESPVTKRTYRKSTPLEIVEAARQADASTMTLEALKVEKQNLDFAKRANETLTHFPRGAKGDLGWRLMKAVHGEFKDPAEFDEAMRAFKSANAAFEQLTKAHGINHTDPSETPTALQAFETAVQEFAKRNNLTYQVALERGTAADPEIRRLYNEANGARN